MSTNAEPRWRILAPANVGFLKNQARDLLNGYRSNDPDSIVLFKDFHPNPPAIENAKLSNAQLTLARAHDFPSWPRLIHGIEMFNAICGDNVDAVASLLCQHPDLLHERVNGVTSNWGPPLACSVQVHAPKVFAKLLEISGQDLQWALGRATLKGRSDMARALLAQGATPDADEVMGPCESLNVEGLRFLAEIGAPLTDHKGNRLAPIALLLEGYHRDPPAKHACLQFFMEQGIEYPDTPIMAFHRGRLDLLKAQFDRDPELIRRRFSYRDIYPVELGCHEDESLGLHGTPLDGTTLVHMAIDFDEVEILSWLLENGADPNARARVGEDGFGGHTPLFNTVVSQAYLSGGQRDAMLARRLLECGADPAITASIKKRIRFIPDESEHYYRNMTAIEYANAFHGRRWVNGGAVQAVEAHIQRNSS